MAYNRDSSPVYYREIQKNAYLKRIPDEVSGSKLRPLGLMKPPLKPLWTQLCVHNGRTPYLEQYRDMNAARAHRPAWRASLLTARHVTASVTARDNEYDFLIDTHQGPVRMLAPDWESMQDWVMTLRTKLHELKILPLCENVYAAPPAPPAPPPAPRAAARDPTSPLPPTPPVPPDRVPGIDLTPIVRTTTQPVEATPLQPEPAEAEPPPSQTTPPITIPENIDISSWETTEAPFTSLPSTSQAPKSVTKICGQNICLDDSIFKRTGESDDEDFLSEDRSSVCSKDNSVNSEVNNYKQTMVVSDQRNDTIENGTSDRPSNITVIQVSNKEAPHTAIPVIGPETDVFDFDFKSTPNSSRNPNFVNIVNTEVNVQNEYGTVFTKEPEYGHLSLTTTVSLSGDVKVTDVNGKRENEGLYEKLCLASTSNNAKASPLPIRRLKGHDKIRKSSLPNLDAVNSDPTYEYLFLSHNNNSSDHNTSISSSIIPISTNTTPISTNINTISSNVTSISSNITPISSNITPISNNITPISTNIAPISTNITSTSSITTTAANITTLSTNTTNTSNVMLNSEISTSRVHVNSVAIVNPNTRVIRSNIERTHSQNNAYDVSPRREVGVEQNGPKRNGKLEKIETAQPKPIWKRGLTELSLLSRLRGIGQGKRQDSPNRNGPDDRSGVTSPAKVVHRSRPEVRIDRNRRRSSSLSNGQSPPARPIPLTLEPLLVRQAGALRSEQRRGAALVAPVLTADPPVFADYNKQVWVAWWGGATRWGGRGGDRVAGVRGAQPAHAHHARQLLAHAHARTVDVLFHRVPLGKIYVVKKRDQEALGIKLDAECNISRVEAESPAAVAGLPPPGKWAVTEINGRAINLLKGGEEDMNRLSLHGTEASVLIQPSALVKKLRAAIKGNKSLLGLR